MVRYRLVATAAEDDLNSNKRKTMNSASRQRAPTLTAAFQRVTSRRHGRGHGTLVSHSTDVGCISRGDGSEETAFCVCYRSCCTDQRYQGPPPIGWVYAPYTQCADPPQCSMGVVNVPADGLNVRVVPNGPPVMSLVNGTVFYSLQRQVDWLLVAASTPQ